jgi:hypothetical protein
MTGSDRYAATVLRISLSIFFLWDDFSLYLDLFEFTEPDEVIAVPGPGAWLVLLKCKKRYLPAW